MSKLKSRTVPRFNFPGFNRGGRSGAGRAIVAGVGDSGRGRRIRAWLALALWIVLVLILSGTDFSAVNTRGWLRELVLRLVPGVSDAALEAAHVLVRRGAHVFEYAVLALLALRALRLSWPGLALRPAAATLALVAAVALVDEAHQARLAARTGSPADVALDLAGGAAALAALGFLRRGRRRPEATAGA